MTAGIPTVRRLTSDDALPLARLRLQALEREPASFESAPGDDRLEQPGYIASILADPRHGVFGALGDRLVGFVGAAPSSHAKAAHCYELWGLYVEPPSAAAVSRERS